MAIQNPNSCEQGYDPDHTANPYHTIITRYGYTYSHSTPVTHAYGPIIYHTYKQAGHCASVHLPDSSGWRWSTSTRTGSGWETVGRGQEALEKHLKNKAKRYKELRAKKENV